MKILLKAVRITDIKSPHHNSSKDILIEHGAIQKIATSIDPSDATVIAIPQLHVSQGWVDFKCRFNDPGSDEGGGIMAGLDAAAFGGFTHVGVLPSDHPVTDTRSGIEYKLRMASQHAVQLHPIGALSKGIKGQSLAEMADMREAGAHWFSDNQPNQNRLLIQALLYSRDIYARVIVSTHSTDYSTAAQVHEGMASTFTGLTGHPSFDEKIQVLKAIEIAKYTEVPVHISGISTRECLPIIAAAKNEGIRISCDVHLMNLCCTEEHVMNFDTRFKVQPVLRTEEDRIALVQALRSGVIDAVVSDHHAVIVDQKRVPFDEAEFGSIQLPTAFSALKKFTGLSSDQVVELLSVRNRVTFDIEMNPIDLNSRADLTLYLPNEILETTLPFSKELSPFMEHALEGKAVGIIHGQRCILNNEYLG